MLLHPLRMPGTVPQQNGYWGSPLLGHISTADYQLLDCTARSRNHCSMCHRVDQRVRQQDTGLFLAYDLRRSASRKGVWPIFMQLQPVQNTYLLCTD